MFPNASVYIKSYTFFYLYKQSWNLDGGLLEVIGSHSYAAQ